MSVLGTLVTPWNAAVALVLVVLYVLWQATKEFGKWEKKGLFSIKPLPFFGNQKDLFLAKTDFWTFHKEFYQKSAGHKVAIFYEGGEPCLYVRDLDLIKRVMVTDFDHFTDFGFLPSIVADMPINDFGLANAKGEEWRKLKSSISPAFSLKNMKAIASKLNKVCLRVMNKLEQRADKDAPIELDQIFRHFTMDSIASTVFSIDVDSTANPENEFLKNGVNFLQGWRFFLSGMMPTLVYWLNIGAFNPTASEYFSRVTRRLIKERDAAAAEGEKPGYDDILSLMMRARDGLLERSEDDFGGTKPLSTLMTNKMIERTIMQFFIDGFDTVASFTGAIVYMIGTNPVVQEKLAEEVFEVASRCGDTLTGEDVLELKYLDQVISETLRLLPPPATVRTCTKEWRVPDTDIVVPVGMRVHIPIIGIHLDSSFYERPEEFDPDRWSPENRSKLVGGSYMPFGFGPRQCMGMKIARMEMKVFVYQLLRHFRLETCEKTTIPMQLSKKMTSVIEGGVWFRLVDRSA